MNPSKLFALVDLFRQGHALADPALWKKRQVAATLLIPVLAALAHVLAAFNVGSPLNDAQINALAGGLVVAINFVLTFATTDKIGLLPPSSDAPDLRGRGEPAGGDAGAAVDDGQPDAGDGPSDSASAGDPEPEDVAPAAVPVVAAPATRRDDHDLWAIFHNDSP